MWEWSSLRLCDQGLDLTDYCNENGSGHYLIPDIDDYRKYNVSTSLHYIFFTSTVCGKSTFGRSDHVSQL